MKFPESWLREWCNPPLSTQELADTLTMGGFEVESVTQAAPPFSGVVVGEIVACEQHPNADKLRVCQVAAGSFTAQGTLQIVCGAPNARAGIKVPLAMVGASLPPAEGSAQPFEIKDAKLRGVQSAGMLCSARELGLSTDHGGLLELDAGLVPGTNLREALSLDDAVLELKLTPNLGHALSVQGVARELSALTGAALKQPEFRKAEVTHNTRVKVTVKDHDLCGRFSGRVVQGVDPKADTPAWMVQRLARCGQRSVNALVDISNYVMFELGRPSHIFDFDKIHGALEVRWGKEGETLELLNGQTVKLDAKVGVIADEQGVESLAGIMGGQATATSDATRNVYVEAAFWYPEAVQGRSRRYGFATDAGHRFERGVDPSTTVDHVEHITRLIQSVCGGQAGPMDDQQCAMPTRAPVSLRVSRATQVIGMPITQVQCLDVFARMGLKATVDESKGRITVIPPPWRFDLQIEEDLIEEVARVVGFNALPDTPVVSSIAPKPITETRRSTHALRHRMAALGYQETINYSFVDAAWERDWAANNDPIAVLNPIASNMSVMRSTLLGSLLDVLQRNVARRAPRVRVFEVGRVYARDAQVVDGEASVCGVAQPLKLAALAYGDVASVQWGVAARPVDFHDLKGDLEALVAPSTLTLKAAAHATFHPGRCARVLMKTSQGEQDIGWIGELHPRWRQQLELSTAPLLMELDLHALQQRDVPQASDVARQQAVLRDLAVVLNDRVAYDDVIRAAKAAGGAMLKDIKAFDRYKPKQSSDMAPDEHSLALRLTWLDEQAALTDERTDEAMARVREALQQQVLARVRG
jgi:phenylalanyl-tRNA synthetase beta chain